MRKLIATTVTAAGLLAATAGAATQDTLSITASPSLVVYGKTAVISGTLAPAKANQNVTVQAQECGRTNYLKVTTVKTNSTGAYTTTVTPTVNTNYQARLKSLLSSAVAVKVQPVVQLTRLARGSFSAKVTAGQSLSGKTLLFQRYSKLKKRWLLVKRVVLTTVTAGTPKPTTISSAAFKSKVARTARVRLVLTTAQASPCYVSAKSNIVRA